MTQVGVALIYAMGDISGPRNRKEIDGKGGMALLSLVATQGRELRIRIEGTDALRLCEQSRP